MARSRELTFDEIGNDISTFAADGTVDLDITFTPITGSRVVAESIGRRWMTDRGSLFWDTSVGIGVTRLTSADVDRVTQERWRMALTAEALKVDGVSSVAVTLETATDDDRRLVPSAKVNTKAGTSTLLVDIGDAVTALRALVT